MPAADAASTSDVLERVRDYVRRAVRMPELGDEDDIFESGLVSSLFLAQLMTFVEQDLGVPIDDADLTLDNFRSAAAIARFAQEKQTA